VGVAKVPGGFHKLRLLTVLSEDVNKQSDGFTSMFFHRTPRAASSTNLEMGVAVSGNAGGALRVAVGVAVVTVLVVDDAEGERTYLERDGECGMIGKMKCPMIAMKLSVIRGATIE
jgi:hypothetical protein